MFIFKRLTLLFLTLAYILALLISCTKDEGDGAGSGSTGGGDTGAGSEPNLDGIVPDTVSFADINYSRPDADILCIWLSKVEDDVRAGSLSAKALAEEVDAADILYANYLSMFSYAELMRAKDSSNTFYTQEYEALVTDFPKVKEAKERLGRAIALSEHREALITKTLDDAIALRLDVADKMNEELIALLRAEEELKRDFALLSPRTVNITCGGITDTYEATIIRLREALGSNTPHFTQATELCAELYEKALSQSKRSIFASLVKLRSGIATALGYTDYNEFSYALAGYDYTPNIYAGFAEDISRYLTPAYSDLTIKIFNPYFNNKPPKPLDENAALSDILELYKKIDPNLHKAFGNMISSKLYDVSAQDPNRSPSSYVTYFNNKSVPYVFHTSRGDATDYSSLSYCFGGYYSALVNKNENQTPLDKELSAKVLEMLTLSSLTADLDNDGAKHVYYLAAKGIMKELSQLSFKALLEHEIYSLKYSEISESAINEIVKSTAEKFSLQVSNISDVICSEFILNPDFLHCKSLALFYSCGVLLKASDTRQMLDVFNALVVRTNGKPHKDVLSDFGIASPITESAVRDIVDELYYSINGSHYYKDNGSQNNAA